jgi:hypothetical protein
MNACLIMYNKIIEDERGKDLYYTFYELIGCPMRVQRRKYRLAHFIHSYQTIRDNEVHDDLQMISLRSDGDGMINKT